MTNVTHSRIYPAHAGINPYRLGGAERERDLPRTRGDKPVWVSEEVSALASTPHTRG